MSQPSVKKNYIFRLFYEILTMITPFLTAPYAARVLGADGIGTYSYTLSYMTFLMMFAALGTQSYGSREISRTRDDKDLNTKLFWEIEILTVFTSLFCLGVWLVFICFMPNYKIYFLALIPCLLSTMFDISWYYIGHEKVGYTVFWNAVCKILGVITLFAVVHSKSDLVLYILLNSFISLFGSISMWIYLPRMLNKVRFKELKAANHFKKTLIYFIPTIATSVYTVLDKTLIGVITHDEYENGYYEQATKIINISKSITFAAVNFVMSARMTYLFVENKINEIKQRILKSMSFIFLMGYGCMFGIIGVAKNFVPAFFGEGYDPVVKLLYMMSTLLIIIGVSNCLGFQYYTPVGLIGKSSRYIIIGSVTNLVLNIILIPRYGSFGAVIGSIGAELVISTLFLVNCDGYLRFKNLVEMSYKRIIAGLIMVVIIYYIGLIDGLNLYVLLVIQIIVGVLIYGCILLLLRDKLFKELFFNYLYKYKAVLLKKR